MSLGKLPAELRVAFGVVLVVAFSVAYALGVYWLAHQMSIVPFIVVYIVASVTYAFLVEVLKAFRAQLR